MTLLKPSEIYNSQDSIGASYDDGRGIGETLDDIVYKRCSVSSIPTIRVIKCQIHGSSERWHSGDNRRLWVFKQLERLGYLDQITVGVTYRVGAHSRKFSTQNGGEHVRVRNGGPRGQAYLLPDGYCKACA